MSAELPADQDPKPALAAAAFAKLTSGMDWEEVWKILEPMKSTGRISCDDAQSTMSVMIGPDSDVHLMMQKHPRADALRFGESFRCRTWAGGGRYDHVQIALVLLAVAIVADRPNDSCQK